MSREKSAKFAGIALAIHDENKPKPRIGKRELASLQENTYGKYVSQDKPNSSQIQQDPKNYTVLTRLTGKRAMPEKEIDAQSHLEDHKMSSMNLRSQSSDYNPAKKQTGSWPESDEIYENFHNKYNKKSEKELRKRINQYYSRTLPNQETAYWIEKVENLYQAYVKRGKSAVWINLDEIPNNLLWMKHLADEGIKLGGREEGESVSWEEWKNIGKGINNRIAEIIEIYPPVPEFNLPELYFCRWVGENLGTAAFLPFEELQCSAMIKAFIMEKSVKPLRKIRLWKHIPIGTKSPAHGNRKFCDGDNSQPFDANFFLSKKVYKSHGCGKKRTIFVGLKHRNEAIKKYKKDYIKSNDCLFIALNSLFHCIPKKLIQIIQNSTKNEWLNFTEKLRLCFEKSNLKIKVVWSVYKNNVSGTLIQNIKMLGLNSGKLLVLYRGKGIAHCGIIENGNVKKIKIFNNLGDLKGKWVRQRGLLEDLGKEITEIGILKINKI